MGSVLKRGKHYQLKWADAFGRPQRQMSKATKEREAYLLLYEIELKVDRQKKGLDALPVKAANLTLGGLCEWWLSTVCTPNSMDSERPRLEKHVIRHSIGSEPLRAVTAEMLQAFFAKKRADKELVAPASVNKLRGTLLSVFTDAKEAKLWGLANPLADVKRAEVPKNKKYPTLRAEEVPLVLAHVPDEWRDFFAAAVWWGLRKGELCGLQKGDLDFEFNTAWICRSYNYETTKGGHGDALPIPPTLLPFLKEAVRKSPSKWVFPGPNGLMRTKDCDPQDVLRTAMRKAGLVSGYVHSCRRCKANKKPYEERATAPMMKRCPVCGMVLWVKAEARPMTFHGLRHTTATLLIRAGVKPAFIQKIMRHANISTTIDMYGHLDVADLVEPLQKVVPLSEEQQRQLVAVNSGPDFSGTSEAQPMSASGVGPSDISEKAKMSEGFNDGRSRDRTYDPCRVKAGEDVGSARTNVPSRGQTRTKARGVGSQPTPTLDTGGRFSGTPWAHGLRAVPSGVDNLLGVKEVARRLGVHPASVYKLCESGRLRHSRVLSAIRISERDLADFLAGVGQ